MNKSGIVLARTIAAATVAATVICCGAGGSTAPDVLGQSGTDGEPNLVEDFSTYSSTTNLLSDPRGIYAPSEDFYNNTSLGGGSKNNGAGTIELDKSEGYGALSQSMKYTWFSYSSPGPGGQIRRLLRWGSPQSEAWIEVAFKFSANFKTDFGYSGGASYKWLFGVGPNQGHGWALVTVGSGGVIDQYYEDMSGGTSEHPTPYSNNFSLSNLADGNWHVLRMHIKRTSPVIFDVMIDGVRNRAPLANWSSSANLWGLMLGQNINMRPVNNVQTLKYGYIKVWYAGNEPQW